MNRFYSTGSYRQQDTFSAIQQFMKASFFRSCGTASPDFINYKIPAEMENKRSEVEVQKNGLKNV